MLSLIFYALKIIPSCSPIASAKGQHGRERERRAAGEAPRGVANLLV